MAEWSKAVDSKSIVGQPTAGSNPALSAIHVLLYFFPGGVSEWPKELAWKASVGQPTAGSNPALSAIFLRHWRRPKVVVGSPWSGIRELRQDRKVATVSVSPRYGGARPSPGASFIVTGTT